MVYLDEVDKIRVGGSPTAVGYGKDIGGEGVQQVINSIYYIVFTITRIL